MARRATDDGLIPAGRATHATWVRSPPLAGILTTSHQGLCVKVRPRSVAPEPLRRTNSEPSGLQDGWTNSAAAVVSWTGSPPLERIFHRCPPSRSCRRSTGRQAIRPERIPACRRCPRSGVEPPRPRPAPSRSAPRPEKPPCPRQGRRCASASTWPGRAHR